MQGPLSSHQAPLPPLHPFPPQGALAASARVKSLLSQQSKSDRPSIHQNKSWRRKRFSGWRGGIIWCIVLAAAIFLTNLCLTIWAATRFGVHGGLGTIHNGSCSTTKKMGLWLHLAINALGTMLLAASNYCMQILSSPTRAEVDKAHAKRLFLDIGLPSVKNMRKIAPFRVLLWWCLGLSSVPLHLL